MRFLISGLTSLVVAVGMTGLAAAAQTEPQAQQPQTQQPQTSSSQMNNAQNQNKGYSVAEVRDAQQKLKDSGDYTGNIDGIYGPQTRAAVEKYQQSQNLTVNGRLDHQTREKLGIHK